MKKNFYLKSIIDIQSSIKDAIENLNSTDLQICLICKDKKLIGTLTDGDIRRALLKGITLNDSIDKICNKNYYFIKLKDLSKRPEAENLLGIYSSIKNQSLEISIHEFSEKNFSFFKEKLSIELSERIEPISSEIKKLLGDTKYLDDILSDGSDKANDIAQGKIRDLKKILGF